MKNTILKKAEKLDNYQRYQYLINLGIESLNNPNLSSTLLELSKSNIDYVVMLADMSASGSFNSEVLSNCIINNTHSINSLNLASKYFTSEEILSISSTLNYKALMKLIHQLHLNNRHTDIELIYNQVTPKIKKKLLAYTSFSFILTNLNILDLPSYPNSFILKFITNHPTSILDFYSVIYHNDKLDTQYKVKYLNIILKTCLIKNNKLGFTLLNTYVDDVSIDTLLAYLNFYPSQVTKIITDRNKYYNVEVKANTLNKLNDEDLLNLTKTLKISNLTTNYPLLKHPKRSLLYDDLVKVSCDKDNILSYTFIKSIPSIDTRVKQALLAFNHYDEPALKLPYLEFLNINTSCQLASDYINHNNSSIRLQCIEPIIASGAYYQASITEILSFISKRKNEQDPIRLVMIKSLTKIPCSSFTPDHITLLEPIIKAALEARDCSINTINYSVILLFKLFNDYNTFALKQLILILKKYKYLNIPNEISILTNESISLLDASLTPLLKDYLNSNNPYDVIHMINNLRMVLIRIDNSNIIELLKKTCFDSRADLAKRALHLLISMGYKQLVYEVMPILLKNDASWINDHHVATYIGNKRQSLLIPFLKPTKYKNKFPSKTKILIMFKVNFKRWTKQQQATYARSLYEIIIQKDMSKYEYSICIDTLRQLPSIDNNYLFKLASLDNPNIDIRNKALSALAKTNNKEALYYLLDALYDDRASIAAYSLSLIINRVPINGIFNILCEAPKNKVTIAKEIYTLIGTLDTPESLNYLMDSLKDNDLHKDIRISILNTLKGYLDYPIVQDYFIKSIPEQPINILVETIKLPVDTLSYNTNAWFSNYMYQLLLHSNRDVKLATLHQLVNTQIYKFNNDLFTSLCKLVSDADKTISNLACKSLINLNSKDHSIELVNIFANIPNPITLNTIIDYIISLDQDNTNQQFSYLLATILVDNNYMITLSFKLAFSTLNYELLLDYINYSTNNNLLNPILVEYNISTIESLVNNYDVKDIIKLELILRESNDDSLKRIGLELIRLLLIDEAANDDYRNILNTYQSDNCLWLKEIALLIE